jgi:DNA-binding CsgD family transcriptional regulator
LTEDVSSRGGPQRVIRERESELSQLDALLADAGRSRGRVMLIQGAAGIGKTRLLQEARRRAAAAGMAVVSARGGELERDFGFGAVRQLLEPVVLRAGAAERDELLAGAARLADRVFAREPTEAAAGRNHAHAVLHGLYWLTVNLAERSPLLIAVDDVHWVDGPSLRFLHYLARRLEGMPIALVLASRTGEDATDSELVWALELEAELPVVRPGPLSQAGVESVIRANLGSDASQALCLACHEATGGNPFLLSEVLEELRSEHRPAGEISPAVVRRLAPERIAASLLLRVGRLDPAAAELTRAVAVLGQEASLARAGELAGLKPTQAYALAASLADAAILEQGEPLRFVHPIVRAAIYEDASERQRAELHRRAARSLSAQGAAPESIAIHLLAAPPTGDPDVVATLRESARTARARGAAAAAVRQLRRAMIEPPADAGRASLLLELGMVERDLGLQEAADHLRRAAELTDDDALRARALVEMAWAAGPQRDVQRKLIPLLERGAERVRPHDRELALKLQAARLAALMLNPDHPTRFEDEAERFRDLSGTTPAECALLSFVARKACLTGATIHEAGELAERAARHPALMQEGARSIWLLNTTVSLRVAERFALAEELLGHAIELARRRGAAHDFGYASTMRALTRHSVGDLRGAIADARAALDAAGPVGTFEFQPVTPLAQSLADQGRTEEAEELLVRHGFDGELPPERVFTALLIARARVRTVAGDLLAARADLEEALDRLTRARGRGVTGFDARLELALVLRSLGEPDAARRQADEALEATRGWQGAKVLGGALRVAGLLRGGEEGLALLDRAVDTLEATQARLWHAQALVDYGAALRRAGKPTAARARLAAGMDMAHHCGATGLVGRARTELESAGARPRRTALSGRDALTPSELRVAEMAVQGMTNKEIAQALFVTLRTIEMHLSNAYVKLTITSRRDLRAALGTPA